MDGASKVARTVVLAHPLDGAMAEAVGRVAWIRTARAPVADVVRETHIVLLVPDHPSSAGDLVVRPGGGRPATKEADTVKGAQGAAQFTLEAALARMRARTHHTLAPGVELGLEAGATPVSVVVAVLGAPEARVAGAAVSLVVRAQLGKPFDAAKPLSCIRGLMRRCIKNTLICMSTLVAILYMACLHVPP